MPVSNSKPDIRSVPFSEIEAFIEKSGEKKFRAKQIHEWLWKKSIQSFQEMSNLSADLREQLDSCFSFPLQQTEQTQKSNDGTIKSTFRLHDGHLVEGVLIPTEKRITACISSQAGCSLTCKFCATGKMKLQRNLTAAEIYDQVTAIKQQAEANYNKPLTNIVYMGMGEPLLNYRNVLQSVYYLTSEKGLNMSPTRITVSTAGIAKMICKLADDDIKFNLALSLHAANDEKRNAIMPINEQNSLDSLAKSLKYFHGKTGKRITYEYIIFDGFNDEITDAMELAEFCNHAPSKVNIIEYNSIEGATFQQAKEEKTNAFVQHLHSKKIVAKVRRSRGKDIDAACGQLANVPNRKGALA